MSGDAPEKANRKANKRVVIFSQAGCPPCDWAKAFLTELGIPFEVRDVRTDSAAVRDLVEGYKSQSTPTIVVGSPPDEQVMVGFDPERLEKMLKHEV